MAETPKPPRKPAPPPAPPAAPGSVRPVIKRAAPARPRAEPLPVGKLASPASPPAPRVVTPSLDVGHGGVSGAYRVRRKGTPIGVWIGLGVGIVAVGILGFVLLNRGDEPKVARSKDNAGEKPAKKAGDNPSEKETAAASPDKAAVGDKVAGKTETPAKDKAPTKDGEKTGEKTPEPKKPESPQAKPAVTPRPAPADVAPVQEFRGIEEIPIGETPAGLANLIAESTALLKEGKFNEFFETHVDPRDRGAIPSADPLRSARQSPYDVLLQGSQRIGAIIAAIGERKPRLLEDGKIAVFELGPRTRPTFVEHEGKWYLSRGSATAMDRRFRSLTDQEEIVYLLEVTNHGKPAVPASQGQREGGEQAILEKLMQMGAIVAVSPIEEVELRRSAVMLTDKYKGGDEGLKLLNELNPYSQLMVLVIDGIQGGVTEDFGLMELDDLTKLEYMKFVNTPTTMHSVTIHFEKMSELRTLIFDGGNQVSDADIRNHFMRMANLRGIHMRGKKLSDSTLAELTSDKHPALEWIDVNPDNVTDAGVAAFRATRPTVWVEY